MSEEAQDWGAKASAKASLETKECIKCHNHLMPDAVFCRHCGTPVDPEAAAAQELALPAGAASLFDEVKQQLK